MNPLTGLVLGQLGILVAVLILHVRVGALERRARLIRGPR